MTEIKILASDGIEAAAREKLQKLLDKKEEEPAS